MKNKKFQKRLKQQNDFLLRRLEIQNETIHSVIESLIENYASNYMLMHFFLGKIKF